MAAVRSYTPLSLRVAHPGAHSFAVRMSAFGKRDMQMSANAKEKDDGSEPIPLA
jgi:hypothetical protein